MNYFAPLLSWVQETLYLLGVRKAAIIARAWMSVFCDLSQSRTRVGLET